jgi:hypothetical protein
MTDIAKAILAIDPDADVSVNGEDINQITWLNGTTPISKADIEAKMTELQAEYPTHEDCIHALLDGGDTLTELQAKRTAIKNKYPKE